MSLAGLFSRLKRSRPDPTEREEPTLLPRKRVSAAATSAANAAVDQVRRQARQRLIGAAVLLTLGVVAFPVVFETQPRSAVPVDLPMRITQAPEAQTAAQTRALDPVESTSGQSPASPPEALPGSAAGAEPVSEPIAGDAATSSAQTAPREGMPSDAAGAESTQPPAERPGSSVPAPPTKRLSVSSPAPGQSAAPSSSDTPGATAQTAAQRYIVQVGAFADAGAVRSLRARIERLGLTTYTQAVDTAGGRRIRVRLGPYGSREEANRALEKLQQSGLSGGMVLSL